MKYMNPFILTLKTYKSNVEIHKHSAFQLVFTNDNHFDSTIDFIEYPTIYGFLIKPHVRHLCIASDSILNIINIEPYSPIGFYVQSLFTDTHNSLIFHSAAALTNCFHSPENLKDEALKNILSTLLTNQQDRQTDERIVRILDYIKANYYEQNITPQLFADLVFLSPSRLASLFKQETRSSLSKYLLWTRLKHAITLTLSKKEMTLTEIAYSTGFYDLPQLNKYMYEMIGVSPKALKQNSDLIQVY